MWPKFAFWSPCPHILMHIYSLRMLLTYPKAKLQMWMHIFCIEYSMVDTWQRKKSLYGGALTYFGTYFESILLLALVLRMFDGIARGFMLLAHGI